MADVPLTPSTIGRRIASVRVLRGLRQEDLAERAGVALSTVARAENEDTTPTVATLALLHEALACPLDYLVSGKGAPGEP
jgi:transcriptional regulator with XRE-family HTH domain